LTTHAIGTEALRNDVAHAAARAREMCERARRQGGETVSLLDVSHALYAALASLDAMVAGDDLIDLT
jgi:hypothetical protein